MDTTCDGGVGVAGIAKVEHISETLRNERLNTIRSVDVTIAGRATVVHSSETHRS